VVLPRGLKYIRIGAFGECPNLNHLAMPSGVESVDVAFVRGCSSLRRLRIPTSVWQIPASAFSDAGLVELTVGPVSCVRDVVAAFPRLRRLTLVCPLEPYDDVRESFLAGCERLVQVTLPSNTPSIGDSAFEGCSGLTHFAFPASVSTIGKRAFAGCTSLAELRIPSAVKTIGEAAFYGCSSVTELTIAPGVETVGRRAFDGMKLNRLVMSGRGMPRPGLVSELKGCLAPGIVIVAPPVARQRFGLS
jgi:hypothetical protein